MSPLNVNSASIFSRRQYTLAMLAVAYMLNFMDRQILVILQEPIKADLGLADWQLGLLTGFAFAIFYTIMGIPIARLADRGNRRNIISISIAIWSAMTAACGLAQNFWHMMLARIGVGVGEAGCSPPAHSIISDLYEPENRATAMATYNVGVYFGILVGFMLGGWINEFFGWRMAFAAVGLPGILFALWMWLTVQEPERRDAAPEAPPLASVFNTLWSSRCFRHLALAGSLHAFVGYGVGNWAPSFFIRSHGLSVVEVAMLFAPIGAFAGAIGALLGGYYSDKLSQRDVRWNIWLPGLAVFCSVPFSMTVYLVDGPYVALVLSIIPVVLGATYLGPMLAITHSLVAPRMRAVASSILFLILNLIGLGIGPWATGLISDLLQPTLGSESLRWALIIVILGNVWCAVHYYFSAKHLSCDLARVPAA